MWEDLVGMWCCWPVYIFVCMDGVKAPLVSAPDLFSCGWTTISGPVFTCWLTHSISINKNGIYLILGAAAVTFLKVFVSPAFQYSLYIHVCKCFISGAFFRKRRLEITCSNVVPHNGIDNERKCLRMWCTNNLSRIVVYFSFDVCVAGLLVCVDGLLVALTVCHSLSNLQLCVILWNGPILF